MEIHILGPLEIIEGGRRLDLGRPRQRIVLAMLLLHAGRVTSMDRIMEAIYEGDPPATSRSQVQVCISALRRLFANCGHPDVITTEAQGYVFRCPGANIDAHQFTSLAEDARRARVKGESAAAVRAYRQALLLWSGAVLEGIGSRLVQSIASRLTEQRLTLNEDCIELELEVGRHREIIGELTALVQQHPLRERLSGLLMLALYRSGRKAEALETYRRAREIMIEELGLEPGEELQRLLQAVLTSAESLKATVARPVARPAVHAAVPRRLPADIADFTGRTAQIDVISKLLVPENHQLAVPIVVLTGKPGVGKTTIAVHACHTLAERFPDGQLYANLRGGSSPVLHPKQALERFLRALGVPGSEVPDSLEERAELYRAILSDRRVLVLLDDVGSESQVLPMVPGYPGCAVLVTSRSRLAGLAGAWTVEVGMFDPHASIALLRRIVGGARIDADPSSATALARLCGHLPLALRISGARLGARPNWTIDRLVERLADEAQRLDELRYGEMGIRATLSVAYDTLRESARRLLRRLAILDFTHYADWMAVALLGVSIEHARDLLDELADAQLIEMTTPADGRAEYRLHELTRVFARERVVAEEPASLWKEALGSVLGMLLYLAQRAHRLEYGGDFVQVHSDAPRIPVPDRDADEIIGSPMHWFERERSTLVAGIDQAARAGLVDLCWDLAVTSVTLFESRIYYDDWRQTHEVALAAVEQAGDLRGQAALRYSRGSLCSVEQRFPDARADFEKAARLFRGEGDPHGEALAVRDLAYLDLLCGRLVSAEEGYRRALDVFDRTGDLVAAAFTLHSMARTRLEARDPDGARELLEMSLGLSLTSGCRRVEAQAHCWLGDAFRWSGDITKAAEEYRLCLHAVRTMGDPLGETYALHGIGVALLDQGLLDEAAPALEQGRKLAVAARSRLAEIRALIGLGDLARARGELSVAVAHLERALGLCRKVEAPLCLVRVLTKLSAALAAMGAGRRAHQAANEALALAAGMDPSIVQQVGDDLRFLPGGARVT